MDEYLVRKEIEKISGSLDFNDTQRFVESYTTLVSNSTKVILEQAKNKNKALILFYNLLIEDRHQSIDVESSFGSFLENFKVEDPPNVSISKLLDVAFSIPNPEINDLRLRLNIILSGNADEEYITETIQIGEKLGMQNVKNFLIDYLTIIKDAGSN